MIIFCDVKDCVHNSKELGKCKLTKIYIDKRKSCVVYSLDMNYLRATLRAEVKNIAPNFSSADPETEELVLEASELLFGQEHHAPQSSGEKEKEIAKS